MNITPKQWNKLLKDLGWDSPSYGWTKEKNILKRAIKYGYEQGIKDVEQKILDKLLYIGNEIPSGVAEDKRDKFVLLGYPSEFLGKLQSLTQKEKL